MTAVDVFPDVILMARAWLVSRSAVTALVGQRVSTRTTGVFPEVALERIGGVAPVRVRLDRARIQVSCWAADDITASLVARTVRAELHRMENYVHATGVIGGVEDELGPQHLPDTARTPPTPRYVFTLAIHAHA